MCGMSYVEFLCKYCIPKFYIPAQHTKSNTLVAVWRKESAPFLGKRAFGPFPKYWHFACTICRHGLHSDYGPQFLWSTG